MSGQGDREGVGLQDLVAVDVGDGNFRSRHQVEIVPLGEVEVFLELGQLTGTACRGLVDEQRRMDLAIAVFRCMEVEHEVGESPHQAGALTGEERKAAAGDLGPAGEIEQAERFADFPVGTRLESRRRERPPVAHNPVGRGIPVRGFLVGQIGNRVEVFCHQSIELAEILFQRFESSGTLSEIGLQRLDRFTGLFQSTEFPARLIALGAEPLDIGEHCETTAIELEHPVELRQGSRIEPSSKCLPLGIGGTAQTAEIDHAPLLTKSESRASEPGIRNSRSAWSGDGSC
jgi:hypothetical protein